MGGACERPTRPPGHAGRVYDQCLQRCGAHDPNVNESNTNRQGTFERGGNGCGADYSQPVGPDNWEDCEKRCAQTARPTTSNTCRCIKSDGLKCIEASCD